MGEELYSSKIHFFWELIQNAEDNIYNKNEELIEQIKEEKNEKNEEMNKENNNMKENKDKRVLPFLKVFLNSKSAIFFNNEAGFKAKNLLSLCQIGKSTKTGVGAIGRKGLGFKSVFACSDTPFIVSEPFEFCFRFDGKDEMGYITPYWCQKGGEEREEGVKEERGEEVEIKMKEGGGKMEEEVEKREGEMKEEKETVLEEERGGNKEERRKVVDDVG